MNKRILLLEFHQETNTFTPVTASFHSFSPQGIFEGEACFENRMRAKGTLTGSVNAIRDAGGDVIPTVIMAAPSGGRVSDEVFNHLLERLAWYIDTAGEYHRINTNAFNCAIHRMSPVTSNADEVRSLACAAS